MKSSFEDNYRLAGCVDGDRFSFYPWFLGAVVRSGVFSGLACRHYQNKEYVSAAICSYYFLFNLALGMLYMGPELASKDVQCELAKHLGQTDWDPSEKIRHDDVREFLREARDLLSNELLHTYDDARNMRVFFNYGPRAHAREHEMRFFACNYAPTRIEDVLRKGDTIVRDFAQAIAQLAGSSQQMIGEKLRREADQLLTEQEFGYVDWCPQDVLEAARRACTEVADTLDAEGSAAR